jgi:hypothetical protein
MKRKISKILGVAVTVALIASLFTLAAPVSAGTASWSAELEPTFGVVYKNLCVSGLEINDMAINGDIVYVAAENTTGAQTLYKSTDGGASFASMETTTLFPAGLAIKKVAISKEDPDVVAFYTVENKVYYSTTGGSVWTNLGVPTDTSTTVPDSPGAATAATLYDIDIYGGTSTYVAVGGQNTAGAAELFTYKIAILQNWQAQYTGRNGIAANQSAIMAVTFSPGFGTEKAILAVSCNTTDQTAKFQIFRYETGDTDWNGEIGYLDSTYWGTGIALTNYNALTAGPVAADIAVAADYLANDDDTRLAYVGLAGATSGGGGGIIRLEDANTYNLFKAFSGHTEGVNSLAYHESGILLAGSYESNKVYQFLSPTAPAPKATKTNSLKQPGGSSKAVVAYSGDTVVAATAGDEGSVAVSTDDGYSFNDVALIDTAIGAISDFDINTDASIVYFATYTTDNDTSLWLKQAGKWSRVLSMKDQGAPALLVRMAPDDNTVVYISALNTGEMWVSKNAGEESWKNVPIYALGSSDTILDFAVESADVVYAVDDDSCTKTSNAGASWGMAKKPAEGMTPYMITLASNGDILIGGSDGYLNYSKDGGSTFTRGKDFGTGNAIVVPDDGYADNNIVYVGVGTSVKRGKADTTTTPATRGATTWTVTGMGQYSGVVYALSANSTQYSKLYASLNLENAADTTSPYTDADWSNTGNISSSAPGSNAMPVYNAGRNTLKVSASSGTPKLWAIDTEGTDDVESFTDPVSLAAPTITSPDDEMEVIVNDKSGEAYDVTFTFNRYASTQITSAILQIAADPDFDAILKTDTITGITTDTVASVIGPNTAGSVSTTNVVNYLPGATYYWRVRTTTPLNSPWTATRSFKIESLEEPFAISGPTVGAADVSTMPTLTWAEYEGAIKYEIAVSEFPTFDILEWSANVDNPFYAVGADNALKYSTTYYWRVRGITAEPYLVGRSWVTPAGPWVTGVFTTMAEPVVEEEPEPVVVTEPGETRVEVIKVPVTSAPVIPTYLLWVIVGVGAVLIIALIVLIVRTRRVA